MGRKDEQRELFSAEIQRMRAAVEKTDSKYLKRDYRKAIRRMERELAEYDSNRQKE